MTEKPNEKPREFWLSGLSISQTLSNNSHQEVRIAFTKAKGIQVNGDHIEVIETKAIAQRDQVISDLIEALEKLVATIRINASAHINAHTDLLRLIVVSTDCLPPGKDVAYQHIDVGR